MKRAAIILALAASVVSAALAAQTPSQTPADTPAGNVENGKKLYVDRGCWMCHGFAAHGGEGFGGPRLSGRLAPWPAFSKYIRRPTNQMIPYTAKVLPDQELADIYAWLRTIPPPPAVTVPQH